MLCSYLHLYINYIIYIYRNHIHRRRSHAKTSNPSSDCGEYSCRNSSPFWKVTVMSQPNPPLFGRAIVTSSSGLLRKEIIGFFPYQFRRKFRSMASPKQFWNLYLGAGRVVNDGFSNLCVQNEIKDWQFLLTMKWGPQHHPHFWIWHELVSPQLVG